MRPCHHLAGGPQVLLDDGLLVFIYHDAVVVVVGDLAQRQRLRWDGQQAALHGRHLQPHQCLTISSKLLPDRGLEPCDRSVYLPRHRLTCECGWCTWHRAALRRWLSGGWSRPGWRPDWCCPGPQSHRPCSPSPGESKGIDRNWRFNVFSCLVHERTFSICGITDQQATDGQSYQTRGGDLTVEEPKGDNEEVVLLRVHPHLKHTEEKNM